jgi:hypothetical protein
LKGELAQAFSSNGKDGVANTGTDERERGLADAAGRTSAFDEVGLEMRGIRHSQQIIAIEVLLLNRAVLDSDAFFEGGTEAHQDSAFDLRADAVHVDNCAWVDDRDHPIDVYVAVLDGDLSDLSEIGGLGEEAGDTAATMGSEGLTPSGLLCGEVSMRIICTGSAILPSKLDRGAMGRVAALSSSKYEAEAPLRTSGLSQ